MQSVPVSKPEPPKNDIFLTGLDFLALELTDKCNLECVHCYADSGPSLPMSQFMQPSDWERVIADGYDLGCRKIQFIGGEPTIYPHLAGLIRYSRSLGYELVEVFTNGTAFTEKIKGTLKSSRVSLAFSVYASDAAVHDSITLRAGSFAATINSIRWALGVGLPVHAAIVEMNQNAAGTERTKAFLSNLGVSDIRVDRARGVGRGSAGKNVVSPLNELCGNCWKGRLCVTPAGSVFPCVMSRAWCVGTAAEGIMSIVEGERLWSFRRDLKSRMECSTRACSPQCGPDCSPAQCGPQCSP